MKLLIIDGARRVKLGAEDMDAAEYVRGKVGAGGEVWVKLDEEFPRPANGVVQRATTDEATTVYTPPG